MEIVALHPTAEANRVFCCINSYEPTHLHNPADENIIPLMIYPVTYQDLVHHWDKYLVL